MKQRKSRKKEIEVFIASLSSTERIVFDLSKKSYDRIIRARNLKGACYHITYFLKMVLHREYNIESNAVIGFVNDGTDDIMTSHGWLEYQGSKVDIALSNPNHEQQPGPVLILDQKFQVHGTSNYTYHRERGGAGEQVIQRLSMSGNLQDRLLIQEKENDHKLMIEVGKSEEHIMEYLNSAPSGATYEHFLNLLQ